MSRRPGQNKRSRTGGGLANPWICIALICIACVVAYSTSFRGVFLFDDYKQIVLNERLHDLSDFGAVLAASPRPVTNVTFALNYALAGHTGDGPPPTAGFHAVNLLIHVGAALALFGLIRRTLSLDRFGERIRAGAAPIALSVSLLWALHPLQTQSVTYIVQRSEALMGLCYLLVLYCALRGATAGRGGMRWYLACVLFCALGMGSKAVMVTAPLGALLFDRAFLAGSLPAALRRRWPLYLGLCATWLVLFATGIAQGVLTVRENTPAAVGFSYTGVTPLRYFATQPEVILHYLRLVVLPIGQVLDYGWVAKTKLLEVLPSVLVVSALGLGALWGLVRNTWWGFVGAFFFVVLAPTSSFIPIKDLAFEHRMYLPLAAVLCLLAAVVIRLTEQAGSGRMRLRGAIVAVSCIALGVLTIRRNLVYADEVAMWRTVVERGGNVPRAASNLGIKLKERGDLEGAIEAYKTALDADPDHVQARYNLAQALVLSGRPNEAIWHYQRALEEAPTDTTMRANYAETLRMVGRTEEAREHFELVLAQDPDDAQALESLIGTLLGEESFEEAERLLSELVRIAPDHRSAWVELGLVRFRLGRFSGAASAYQQALRLNAQDADTWYNLGVVEMRRQRSDAAIEAFRRAVKLDPDHTRAHINLGLEYKARGMFEPAVRHLRRALVLRPGSETIRRALEDAQAGLDGGAP